MYLAIDIGGTHVKYGVFNEHAELVEKIKRVTVVKSLDHFMADLHGVIGAFPYGFKGIGISCPGTIDTANNVIREGGSVFCLDGVRIGDVLTARYHIPVVIENDGKIVAYAEKHGGNLRDIADGVAITLGTGVGGGIILNNQLRSGVNFRAGEFSYLISRFNRDEIGRIGQQASAVNMIKKINRLKQRDDLLNGETALGDVHNHDKDAVTIFDNFCRNVAVLILNLQNILDVEKFVIGGGISAQDIVIETIQRYFNELIKKDAIFENFIAPEIARCHYLNDAGLYGAFFKLTQNYHTANSDTAPHKPYSEPMKG